MTSGQFTVLAYGLLAFLVVWGVVLVPQTISQLARFGVVHPRKLAITAAVVLYACLAFAFVFLPLPQAGDAAPAVTTQLTPFQWVADIHRELSDGSASNPITAPAFKSFAMNVLLFTPLGLFARMLWRRGIVGATALGLLVSLAVELTQVTANFGTAPFVYRLFDVDDLMSNTVGALLGWLVAELLLTLRRYRAVSSTDAARPSRATAPVRVGPPRPAAPAGPAGSVRASVRHGGPRTRPLPRRR